MGVWIVVLLLCFNDTATTETYTYRHPLSLHDALPIFFEHRGQRLRSLVQSPGRGQVTAVLVRIRIADHHFLMPALPDLRADLGHREVTCHDRRRAIEVGDRLEQRHDHQVRPARRIAARSEEHTSALQSQMRISYAVFC